MAEKHDPFPQWLRDLETAVPRPPVSLSPHDADNEEAPEEKPEDHERACILNALHGCA
jgi:hypothetical protein